MVELYPWQHTQWAQLANRTQHPHAYLFHGPQGIGKHVLAQRLGQLLLCSNPQQHQPCGQCKSCLLLSAGSHPDFYAVQPEEADKAIRVDQIRALVDFVGTTAQLGGRKLVLLDPAEAMNTQAANALLKSLEEPSGDTVLLLVTHQLSSLLPTIRSRCVKQACRVPSPSEAVRWLQAQLPEVSKEDLAQLLSLARGFPLQAFRLHEQGAVQWQNLMLEELDKLRQGQQWPSAVADAWQAIPLLLIFDWFYQWTLLLVRQQITRSPCQIPNPLLRDYLYRLTAQTECTQVLAFQDWLLQQRHAVQNRANLNRTLLLEALLVQWSDLISAG